MNARWIMLCLAVLAVVVVTLNAVLYPEPAKEDRKTVKRPWVWVN